MSPVIVITTYTDSFKIDLNGASTDRKEARIKFSEIRSLTKLLDDKTVEVVFLNGDINGFPYDLIADIDGGGAPTDQDDLFAKMEAKIFAVT